MKRPPPSRSLPVLRRAVPWVMALLMAGCSDQGGKPPAPPPPPPVTVTQVQQKAATVIGETVGEVRAFREVELRPQVSGNVQSIHFNPGQRVKEGELLFVIDPRPYQASLAQERAAMADAQSTLARARQDAARSEALVRKKFISPAAHDAAVAAVKSAEAAVAQRRAAAERLELELRNTEVKSPITGQIGEQQVQVGGLATAGQTVLAVVSTLDPVYVSFSIPEADYVRFVRDTTDRDSARARPIRLVLPDGSRYGPAGTFDFAERAISDKTGTLALRARFPNPDNLLRPGMSVRVLLVYEEIPDALLVPQRAVTELLGRQFVTVLGADNRAEQRPVELGARVGEHWIVRSGLKPGERVIVDGVQKAPPGTVVAPTMIEG